MDSRSPRTGAPAVAYAAAIRSTEVAGAHQVNPARGVVAGGTVAVLAVAAHGIAGGGVPGSAGLTLLIAAAAAIGALAATLRSPGALVALMALGQPVGHVALSGLVHDGHGSPARELVGDGAMAGAHALATVVFAALLLLAERLYGFVARAVRAVLSRPRPAPVATEGRWARTAAAIRPARGFGAGAPRAPPITA
ncbi:hypothetical protein ACWDOP_26440 [Nocardia sp. NPDC003693]